jgi:hypothetical protein
LDCSTSIDFFDPNDFFEAHLHYQKVKEFCVGGWIKGSHFSSSLTRTDYCGRWENPCQLKSKHVVINIPVKPSFKFRRGRPTSPSREVVMNMDGLKVTHIALPSESPPGNVQPVPQPRPYQAISRFRALLFRQTFHAAPPSVQ